MTERDHSVAKGESKVKYSAGRSLKFPGLKPSDYFLFKEEKDHFACDSRALLVLGLRLIYAGWHRSDVREMIVTLWSQIAQEDLNTQSERVVYTQFSKIRTEKES